MSNKLPPNSMEPRKSPAAPAAPATAPINSNHAIKAEVPAMAQKKEPSITTYTVVEPSNGSSNKQPIITRKNIILGAVLIVLIVLAYAYQGPLKKLQGKLGKQTNIFSKVVTPDIDKIEINSGGATRTFEKKNDKWIISGTKDFPVKKDIVSGFLDDLDKAKSLDMTLASASKDKKADYKTDNSGADIKLYRNDNVIVEFVVGKNTPDFAGTYVSRTDLNNTYSVAENLRKYIDQPDWRDNVIFSSDSSAVNKIRFQYPTRTFTIEKKDGKWIGMLPFGFSVNQDKADKIAKEMSYLTANDIPEQTFAGTGLEKHLVIVQATGDGIDNTIMIGNDNKKGSYFAKKGDSDNIYLISKTDRDALDKTIAQMR